MANLWWHYIDVAVVMIALAWSMSIIARKFVPQKSDRACGGCTKFKAPANQGAPVMLGRRSAAILK